jgi:class 3 adenylate cyclase
MNTNIAKKSPKPPFIARLERLRERSAPLLRFVWRVLLLCLIAAQFSPEYRQRAMGVWIALNIGYALVAGAWAAFHWRPLWAARDISLRWSVCLTLVTTLILYSGKYASLYDSRQSVVGTTNDINSVLWLALMLAPLFLLFLLLSLGMVGASIGAFAARKDNDGLRAAQIGVHGSMTMLLITLLVLYYLLLNVDADQYALPLTTLFFSFPLLTRGYWRQTHRSRPARQQAMRSVRRVWERLMIWRWHSRTRTIVIDLRGAALGLLVATGLLSLPSRLVGPLQSHAFTSLANLRASVHSRGDFVFGDGLTAQQARLKTVRRRIAILRMDEAARYDALQRSEATVQAEMIDRLRQMGAARIILPLPYLYGKAYPAITSPDGPAPDEEDVKRSRRDTKKLANAVQSAHNVLLAMPPNARLVDAKVAQLILAASASGATAIPASETSYLPMIAARWNPNANYPPLAALTCLNINAPEFFKTHFGQFDRLDEIPGCAHPGIASDGVMVDFVGRGPREDFLHVSYSALRANASLPVPDPAHSASNPIADGPLEPAITWKTASSLLKDRVVFLDSLAHPAQITPAGVMTQAEEQAYALSTLLTGESFTRVSPRGFAVLVLFLGLFVGYICANKEPLDALMQAAVPLILTLLVSVFSFLNGRWLDPVLPVLTILMTLTLATQMRFAHERADKRRTSELFGRFVAPHMVQEWLAHSEAELGLGGKREKLCVLFADVRNFTPFAEQHDATEVIDVINAYMTAITDALHAYNGILDKYTGDGLMAFFQILESPAVDVNRAINAALAMRDAALALSLQRAREGKPTLQLGFSLHYGEAVVGLVGNIKQQINYTALGHTVVVAARLQTIAGGGDVVVSEEVYQEAPDGFVYAVGEPVHVKGLSAPVHPYRVLAPRTETI